MKSQESHPVTGFALSDRGKVRAGNEDSFFCDPVIGLFVVADGMGGEQSGEVASRTAVEQFCGLVSPFLVDSDLTVPFEVPQNGDFVLDAMAHAAKEANRTIWEMAQSQAAFRGMGTTLTAAAVHEGNLAVLHIGDSRLYRIGTGGAERLTKDHTRVQDMVERGLITVEEARVHPERHVITRCLGRLRDFKPDAFRVDAGNDDLFLLASDGLFDMLDDETIAGIGLESRSLKKIAEKLVDQANRRGGRDNITVVLFRIPSSEDSDG